MKNITNLLALSLAGLLVAAPAFGAGTLLYQQDFEQPVGTLATDASVGLTHILAGDTGVISATVIDSGNSLGKGGGVDDTYAALLPSTTTLLAGETLQLDAVLQIADDSHGLPYITIGDVAGHTWAGGTRVGFDTNGGLEVACLGPTCNNWPGSAETTYLGNGGTLRMSLLVKTDETTLHYSLDGAPTATFGPFPYGQSSTDQVVMKLHTVNPDVFIDSVSLMLLPIPEPASLALLGLGGLALLRRRR